MYFNLFTHIPHALSKYLLMRSRLVKYISGVSLGGREKGSGGRWGTAGPQASPGNALPTSRRVRDRCPGDENLKGWLVKMQEEEARLLGKAPVRPGSLKYKLAEVSTKDDNSCPHHGKGVCPGVPPSQQSRGF